MAVADTEQDHLTLLNAYNAFMRYGQKDKSWCGNHRINHKALSRAVSIRKQLRKYLERFNIPIVSCEGDAVRLRKCLVSGYFKVCISSLTMRCRTDLAERCKDDAGRYLSVGTGRSCKPCQLDE